MFKQDLQLHKGSLNIEKIHNSWYEKYKNLNLRLNGEILNFSDIYRMNMICSVMWEEYFNDSHSGGRVKKEFFGDKHLRLSDYKDSYVLQTVSTSIRNIIDQYGNKPNGKIWLWEDYQRVVKLAGMIE